MDEPGKTKFTDIGTFAPLTLVLTVLHPGTDLPDRLSCLERQQTWPAELLIVDRGRNAATQAGLQRWTPPPGVTLKVIEAPGASIAQARNLAVESAHYDHIAVTDLTAHLHRDWLTRVWAALGSGADAVTGLIEPVGRTVLQRAIGVVRSPRPDEIGRRTFRTHSGTIGFSKAIWDNVAGYPEWLETGHDFVFELTLRQSRVVITVLTEPIGSARAPETLVGYLTDCWRTANAAGRAGVTTRAGITAAALAGCTAIAMLSRHRSTGLLLLGGLAHLRPVLRRVWRPRKGSAGRKVKPHPEEQQDPLAARLMAVAGVVLIGDTTKTVGYLTGLIAAVRTHNQGTVLAGATRPAASAAGPSVAMDAGPR